MEYSSAFEKMWNIYPRKVEKGNAYKKYMANSDVTIFNLRIGADRREKFYATRILGVSWYESKGQVVSDTVRKGTAQCVIRIPYTAIVEGGKQYISEEEYRSNKALNEAIERMIQIWDGTIHGQTIKNMYENGTDYESICDVAGIDYEDCRED